MLKDRYENKRNIIQAHLQAIWSQPVLKTEFALGLRNFLHLTNEHLRALVELSQPVEHWNAIIVFVLTDMIDPESRKQWQLDNPGTDVLSWELLSKFLDKRSRSVELGGTKVTPQSSVTSLCNQRSPTLTKRVQILLFKAHRVNLAKRIIAFTLVHNSMECVLLINISSVKTKKLCFNCFQSGHSSNACPSKFTCRECKMKHHTLLQRPQKQLPDQRESNKFGVKQDQLLGRNITSEGVAPQADKVKDFLSKLRFPKSKKVLQRYIGFLNFLQNYIPRLSERLSPFFKLLEETSKFYVPTNLVGDFSNLNKLLENSCQLALKQPLKNKQLIVMSDASFTAAGYAIMIEDDPNQKLQSRRKTYAPIAFGSKSFNPTQTKMSIYAKEFLFIYFAFVEFGHLIRGSTFPVIVFTDNRSVTRFFQTKMIPPALWNACDYVLEYNFVIAHVAGSMNTAADFLYRTEVDPTEKLEMTIRNDIHTKAIEVNIQSTGIVEEEQIYILPDEEIDENQLWEEKQNKSKPTMIQRMMSLSYKNFTNLHPV